jgi:hypothetical protein
VKKSHRYRKDAAKKQNNMALSFFTISFVNDGIMRLVSRAALDKWQRFLAFNIVQGSMKNYRPVEIKFSILRYGKESIRSRGERISAMLFERLNAHWAGQQE